VPGTIEITSPEIEVAKDKKSKEADTPGFLVVCWNDPVNLMPYVTHVFCTVFGWDRTRAERHMREVHEKGKSVLVREQFEKAEFYVHQLRKFALHATLETAE
jgi:ATP-dependent Clp protease adaptor protein ClpS